MSNYEKPTISQALLTFVSVAAFVVFMLALWVMM